MLVLALQFSRCYLTPEPFSRDVIGKDDLEAGSTVRHEGDDSFKTEEKTMPAVGRQYKEGPNPSTSAALQRQTYQCTNRCVVLPDRTNVDHRQTKHSLERR